MLLLLYVKFACLQAAWSLTFLSSTSHVTKRMAVLTLFAWVSVCVGGHVSCCSRRKQACFLSRTLTFGALGLFYFSVICWVIRRTSVSCESYFESTPWLSCHSQSNGQWLCWNALALYVVCRTQHDVLLWFFYFIFFLTTHADPTGEVNNFYNSQMESR